MSRHRAPRIGQARREMIQLLLLSIVAALLTGALALPFTLPGGSLSSWDTVVLGVATNVG